MGFTMSKVHESWSEKLERAAAEDVLRNEEPYVRILERALPIDGCAISTVMVLEFLGLRFNARNAQLISSTMRALGYFPLRSRKLLPGGWRQTVARGWVKPLGRGL